MVFLYKKKKTVLKVVFSEENRSEIHFFILLFPSLLCFCPSSILSRPAGKFSPEKYYLNMSCRLLYRGKKIIVSSCFFGVFVKEGPPLSCDYKNERYPVLWIHLIDFSFPDVEIKHFSTNQYMPKYVNQITRSNDFLRWLVCHLNAVSFPSVIKTMKQPDHKHICLFGRRNDCDILVAFSYPLEQNIQWLAL